MASLRVCRGLVRSAGVFYALLKSLEVYSALLGSAGVRCSMIESPVVCRGP